MSETKESHQPQQHGLKNRHVQLIAIGGTIGTGLFMGAGNSIHFAGPSILFGLSHHWFFYVCDDARYW